MDALSYEVSKLFPLRSGDQIVERVSNLIGAAVATNLWLVLLGADRVQLQRLVKVALQPVRGEEMQRGLEKLVRTLESISGGISSVVAVLERPGGEVFTVADVEWARALSSACQGQALELAGVLVSHSVGVRWLAEDDYVHDSTPKS